MGVDTLTERWADRLWLWGRLAAVSALAGSLALLLLTAGLNPDLLIWIPPLLLGGVAMIQLFRHPLLNLSLVLAGAVLIIGYSDGVRVGEVVYGLYLAMFLGHWFVTRMWLRRETVLDSVEARALLLFLIGAGASVILTLTYRGSLTGMASEMISLGMLALFFPVREACAHGRRGLGGVLVAMAALGIFIVARNLWSYQAVALALASPAWIPVGRVVANDGALMAMSLFALTLVACLDDWHGRGWSFLLFLAFAAGLVITQSRGQWLAFVGGGLVLAAIVQPRHRRRLVAGGIAAAVALVAVAAVIAGDYLALLALGLGERASSIGSALSADVSLANRIAESKAVLGHVVRNPIVGHGMGVPFAFFDFTHDVTRSDTFIHNGYVSLWFKFGLWGVVLVLFFWLGSAWRGLTAYRIIGAEALVRAAGLGSGIALLGFTVSANTSNPFFLDDTTFLIGVLAGIAAGTRRRAREADAKTSGRSPAAP